MPEGIDVSTIDTPGWWLQRCLRKLEQRRDRLQGLWERFEGDAPIPKTASEGGREEYKRFRRMSRTNHAEIVVESTGRRMQPTGFKTVETDDRNRDPKAQEIWDENQMAVLWPDIRTKMLALGDSYAICGSDDEKNAVITAEDPRQAVTIHDPARQRVVRAGAKILFDPEYDRDYAYLYWGTRVHVAYRDRGQSGVGKRFQPRFWVWDETKGGVEGVEHGMGRPPIVRFRNRDGVGEFERHVDILDRLDQTVFERSVIAAVAAWRQRALLVPSDKTRDPKTGELIDWANLLSADPGAAWVLPEGVKIWESLQNDLTPLLKAEETDLKKLVAVTSTPMHLFFPDAVSGGSADGANLVGEEHAYKVDDRITRGNEGLRDLMSLALTVEGETKRAERRFIQPLWKPTRRRSLAEISDANSKLQDIPFETRATKYLEFEPWELEDMEAQRDAEFLRQRRLDLVAEEAAAAAAARRPTVVVEQQQLPLPNAS